MDEGTSYFEYDDITDETGPHIPSRKDSAVFQYENHLIVFGGLVPTSTQGSSITRKRYSDKLWILYNMESYVQGQGSGNPTIPEKRAYMDIKTFKYEGVVVGVMFGGYNGKTLDDTWLIVPGYGEDGIAWVRFHKRTVDTPYPSERNSYAMASFNNGVIMTGGIRDSGGPHETWFFHCKQQDSKISKLSVLQKLQENCQWHQIVQNDRDTPYGQIYYQNLASIASNNVLVFDWKDPKRSCTWIFKKTTGTNVDISKSGQWKCVGDNTNMQTIQNSVFVGGNDMTAILYGRSQENIESYPLDTFVYNEDEPDKSTWIVGRVSNVPINQRTQSASCSVINAKWEKGCRHYWW